MIALALKIPNGKLPYLGIRYLGSCYEERQCKEFFLRHYKKEQRIVIEIIPSHLNLKLICNETLLIQSFTHVKYDREKLKNWLYLRGNKEFNFGITIYKDDTDILLQAWDKKLINVVTKMNSLEILELKNEIAPGPW